MSSDRQQTSDEWTAMVKERNHHAERERVAREWMAENFTGKYTGISTLESVIGLLASIEQRVLEEVAKAIIAEHRMGDSDR